MLLNYPNVRFLVAVDPIQLLTMALETVDPTDWSLPPSLYKAVPTEIPQSANASHKSECLGQESNPSPPTHKVCVMSMRPLRV